MCTEPRISSCGMLGCLVRWIILASCSHHSSSRKMRVLNQCCCETQQYSAKLLEESSYFIWKLVISMEISIKISPLIYILVAKTVCFLTSPKEDHPGRGKDSSSGVFSKAEGRNSRVFEMAAVINIQPGGTGGFMNTRQKGKPRDCPHRAGKTASFNRWL